MFGIGKLVIPWLIPRFYFSKIFEIFVFSYTFNSPLSPKAKNENNMLLNST